MIPSLRAPLLIAALTVVCIADVAPAAPLPAATPTSAVPTFIVPLAQSAGTPPAADPDDRSSYRSRRSRNKLIGAGIVLGICGIGWVFKKIRGE